jgi:hypothetical protein
MFWCCREGYIDWHSTRPEQCLPVTGDERTRAAGPVYIRGYIDIERSLLSFSDNAGYRSSHTTALWDDGNTTVPEYRRYHTIQENWRGKP